MCPGFLACALAPAHRGQTGDPQLNPARMPPAQARRAGAARLHVVSRGAMPRFTARPAGKLAGLFYTASLRSLANMTEAIDQLLTKAAGLVGSVIAAVYLGGTRAEQAVQVLAGAAASYYAAPWLSEQLKAPEGFVGFTIGLTAIFLAKKALATIDGLDLKSHLDAALSRISGKKPEGEK